jgi:hypothetical protein
MLALRLILEQKDRPKAASLALMVMRIKLRAQRFSVDRPASREVVAVYETVFRNVIFAGTAGRSG